MNIMRCLICPVFVCFFACFSFGCGGSGGGGDSVGAEAVSALTLPAVLEYHVSNPWYPGDYPNNVPLSVAAEGVEVSLISHPDFPDSPAVRMSGTYVPETEETTLNGESYMWIDSRGLYGIMGLFVPEDVTVEWVAGGNPTSGKFFIDYRGSEMREYIGILIEVNPDAGGEGIPGVDLSLYRSMESELEPMGSFAWDVFEDLQDNGDAPAYQRISSFCYNLWEVVFERVENCFYATSLFLELSDELYEHGGAIDMPAGDVFPPDTGERGTVSLSWTDVNGNDEMGDSDNFSLTLADIWEDDEDDAIDEMCDGTLHLYGLMLDTDDERGVITTIGGDFVFDGFTMQETIDNVLDPDSGVTFSGGFNVTAHELQ